MSSISSINASSVRLQLEARTSNEHYAYAMLSCWWTIQGAQQRLSFKSIARSQQTRTAGTCPCAHIHTQRGKFEQIPIPIHSLYRYGQQLMQLRANYRISQRSPQRFSRDVFLSIKSTQMDQRGNSSGGTESNVQ